MPPFVKFAMIACLLGGGFIEAGEVNSCRYLIINDFQTDPYGIASALRAQARSNGFLVISVILGGHPKSGQ